ncbi:MAG: hypothetical protein E7290_06255 [Lachnospiraceae bacterium]|nr:hypothetical protein [Lachnospiraceae bacterium]
MIQLFGVVVKFLLTNLWVESDILLDLGTAILLLSVVAAIIVDIVLAIRWGRSIKQKLVYIFFMPTNYLWLIYLIWAFWYIGQWIDMISNIYQ